MMTESGSHKTSSTFVTIADPRPVYLLFAYWLLSVIRFPDQHWIFFFKKKTERKSELEKE